MTSKRINFVLPKKRADGSNDTTRSRERLSAVETLDDASFEEVFIFRIKFAPLFRIDETIVARQFSQI